MSAFWEQVGGHLDRGERVFVACVARAYPRLAGPRGAKLLVAEGGGLFGTIGGGMMEHRLVEQGRAVLRAGEAQPESAPWCTAIPAAGERSGMVCEGSQTNVFCVLAGHRDRATVRAVEAAVRDDRPACRRSTAPAFVSRSGSRTSRGRRSRLPRKGAVGAMTRTCSTGAGWR